MHSIIPQDLPISISNGLKLTCYKIQSFQASKRRNQKEANFNARGVLRTLNAPAPRLMCSGAFVRTNARHPLKKNKKILPKRRIWIIGASA